MIQLVYASWWGERKLYTLNGVRTASRATFVRLTLLPNGWLVRYIHANGASMCAGKTRRKVFFHLRYIDWHYFFYSFPWKPITEMLGHA